MAIAPTATISNIVGVSQSIEPMYKNLFVKTNLSGDFTTINDYLIEALKARGMWDDEMVNDLKYFDGDLGEIERIPDDVKEIFRTAFQIDGHWLVECASRRQKWIDMGQSLNLYMSSPNGRKLNDVYLLAWRKGLKTTYYLRTLAATQIEKSTLDINKRGMQPRWMKNKSASANIKVDRETTPTAAPADAPAVVTAEATPTPAATDMTNVQACSVLDPTCEACQ
jgi:ribonucleoside-diphosphate reductase alpha chain